jgi:hypothetical protein
MGRARRIPNRTIREERERSHHDAEEAVDVNAGATEQGKRAPLLFGLTDILWLGSLRRRRQLTPPPEPVSSRKKKPGRPNAVGGYEVRASIGMPKGTHDAHWKKFLVSLH